MAKEEFCRLGKESCSAEKESGRLQLLCYSAKLLGKSAGKQFGQTELLSGQAKLLCCRAALLCCRVKLLSQRAKLVGKRAGHELHQVGRLLKWLATLWRGLRLHLFHDQIVIGIDTDGGGYLHGFTGNVLGI